MRRLAGFLQRRCSTRDFRSDELPLQMPLLGDPHKR
jgi:hypothetical protein